MTGFLGQLPARLDRCVAGSEGIGVVGGLAPGAVLGEDTREGPGELGIDLVADGPQVLYADRGDCFLLFCAHTRNDRGSRLGRGEL